VYHKITPHGIIYSKFEVFIWVALNFYQRCKFARVCTILVQWAIKEEPIKKWKICCFQKRNFLTRSYLYPSLMNPQRQKKSWKKEILIKEVMLIIYLVGWAKGTGGINF
jgi:hypothetical protein